MLDHRHEIIWHTQWASDFRACAVIDKLGSAQLLVPSSHALLPVKQYLQIGSPGFPAGESLSAGAVKRRLRHC